MINWTQALGVAVGIFGFLFLITVHEAGHFLVSKALGVRVNEFSVGMGPLLSQSEKNGTKYSFRLFPIGGYCALQGEFAEDATDEEIENFVDEDPKAFVNQPDWKQILILIAGSCVNFIFGFLLLVIIYSIIGKDIITFGRVLSISWEESIDMITSVFDFLGGLFTGSSSVNDVSGVIGIVAAVSEVANYGLINVFYFIALISLNLSVMNMLPIPGLDGGRLFVMIIKWATFGKLSPKAEKIINAVGLVFLLLIMVLVAVKDVINLI